MTSFEECAMTARRRADAVAFVEGNTKYPDIHGKVMFYQMRDGVIVRAEISGLPKGNGRCSEHVFGFHIHSGTSCSGDSTDPFKNAGTHYDRHNCSHPYHAGDMPPLFSAGGKAFLMFLTNRFDVSEITGKTVIIHSGIDDFTTQPSGNAGDKIACGVITPTARR